MTGIHPADLPAEDGKIQVPRKFSQGWQNWLGTMTEPSLKRRFPDVQTAIAAGVREYRILSYSPVECEWLLKELSEWLDLPVKTVNNF
jgi:hypothetical protein